MKNVKKNLHCARMLSAVVCASCQLPSSPGRYSPRRLPVSSRPWDGSTRAPGTRRPRRPSSGPRVRRGLRVVAPRSEQTRPSVTRRETVLPAGSRAEQTRSLTGDLSGLVQGTLLSDGFLWVILRANVKNAFVSLLYRLKSQSFTRLSFHSDTWLCRVGCWRSA